MIEIRPFIIIDNNLLDDRGHHLALARTIANQALEDDREVHFYVHKDFCGTDVDPRIVIHPVFEMSTYEVFAKKLGDVDLSKEFETVFSLVANNHAETGGVVLMHTCDAHIYRAFARWIETDLFKNTTSLVFHLCTCYEIRLLPGAAVPAEPVALQVWKIARSNEIERRIFMWGETERLADFYQTHFRRHVETLPLPTPQWIVNHIPPPKAPDDRITMLFLGAAREEKGFLELSKLAEKISYDPYLVNRVVLRIQCSEPLAGYSPATRAVVEYLGEYSCCSLIHGPLSVEDYGREFLLADIIWLKYKMTNYFARGSGIVMESFSAGKYVLNSPGMFVDQMNDMGLALPVSTIDDCIERFREMDRNLAARRAYGASIGQLMANRYSASTYLKRLTNRELQAPLYSNLAPGIGSISLPLLVNPLTRSHDPWTKIAAERPSVVPTDADS